MLTDWIERRTMPAEPAEVRQGMNDVNYVDVFGARIKRIELLSAVRRDPVSLAFRS